MTLTAKQIETLERLRFKQMPNIGSTPHYMKRYRIQGRVRVFCGETIMVTQANVYTCKEAQRDLAELRKEGIE